MTNYYVLAFSILLTLCIFTVTLIVAAGILSKNPLVVGITIGVVVFVGFAGICYNIYEVLK